MKAKIAAKTTVIFLTVLISMPTFGGPSASIGLGIPMALMHESEGRLEVEGTIPLPLAEASFYYSLPVGGSASRSFNVGAGVRSISYLIGSSFGGYAWPDLQAEWRLGALVAASRLGGGVIAGYSDSGFSLFAGPVFLPDLSLWWTFGRRASLRLGFGFFGKLSLPGGESALGGLSDSLIIYAGAKAVFGP
jgi:hypothetical protein